MKQIFLLIYLLAYINYVAMELNGNFYEGAGFSGTIGVSINP